VGGEVDEEKRSKVRTEARNAVMPCEFAVEKLRAIESDEKGTLESACE
jgi:hypothetical protein